VIKKYTYTIFDKLFFYFSYIFYKKIIPFEVQEPKWKMWWYEFRYTVAKFKNYTASIAWNYPEDIIKTKFGIYKIRRNTSDAANVSPAFERRDQNYLLKLLGRLLRNGMRVLFLDIGADLGGYSILVANRFKHTAVDVKCFEPLADSCGLIRENLALNGIAGNKVTIYPLALLNEKNHALQIHQDAATPGSSSITQGSGKTVTIKTERLDDVIGADIAPYEAIVMKIDVEGVEKEVLLGARKVLDSGKDVYVMVEDFIKPDIIGYLENAGFSFLAKVTSYNSWWFYKKVS